MTKQYKPIRNLGSDTTWGSWSQHKKEPVKLLVKMKSFEIGTGTTRYAKIKSSYLASMRDI